MTPFARFVLIALFASLLSVIGCGTGGSANAHSALPQTFPADAIDWNHNDVDHVKFVRKFSLADYKKLVVEPVNTVDCKLPDRDDNTYQPVVDYLAAAPALLTEILQAKLKGTIPVVTPADASSAPGKALILRTRITEVNPGSRAARYAVGMGAGRAQTFMRGQIIDSSTNQTLIEFENAKATGWGGFFGGSYEKVFHKELTELGDSIANLLIAFAPPRK
jgi:hypothetical protein